MDVAVTELRAQLSAWIAAAQKGEDVVITDRGTPVARLVGIDTASIIERLTEDGTISRPTTASRPIAGKPAAKPKRPVADIISDQRR